jgi:hypothetical protein
MLMIRHKVANVFYVLASKWNLIECFNTNFFGDLGPLLQHNILKKQHLFGSGAESSVLKTTFFN